MPANILLVGSRCTGKTTVGRLLAERLGWAFADVDDRIEAVAGKSIAEIFAAEGEGGFRDREAAALEELCARSAMRDRHRRRCGPARVEPPTPQDQRVRGVARGVAGNALGTHAGRPDTASRRPNLTAAGGEAEVRNLLAAGSRSTAKSRIPSSPSDTLSPEAVADAILNAWNGGSISRSSSGACSSSPPG